MHRVPPSGTPTRFVALDVHRHYVVVGAVDAQQTVVLTPRRFGFATFAAWAQDHLAKTDAVVLEASANAWLLHDQLVPLVASVTVAHPLGIKLIAAARVKTDGRDTIKLAHLLAANLIPPVWVPPAPVRDLRALVTHRKRLVQQRTQARTRLHAVLHRHNLAAPEGKPFAVHQRDWWLALDLAPSEQVRVRQDLELLDALQRLITEVETELGRLSTCSPWVEQVPFLVQLPGIGVLTAMIVLAAIGDITRFPSARQLVGYAGLGPSVHDSGQVHRGGRITKEGRSELRGALVEAAWVAVETHAHWKAQFARLGARIGHQKAIVAIARKLLVAIWHVLTAQVADVNAEVQAVGRKLLQWVSRCGTTPGHRRSRLALLRQYLDQLGLEVDRVTYKGAVYQLPAAPGMATSAKS